ncbi:LysR family transcriptional regulator [Bradyrhizobium sp. CCGUVB1N3]|uniref:LysR family transcriptional regulator n=1 Tax=Bradyrhizobium sp. CCGUVB1N3 TaxID=2949629 RepID=UPI0020B2855D|nr:LysR family transcriptional regulator [Bradyrhizobium sp. CCGUVB1N3]MCP3473975.1 LysR family transcriptional regulator [Bradyrhizobium sp. CCGUVB1N3]
MPTTLDIDTLRSLIAIVDLKSFSRAAERVGRSQSAISLQIARLEGLVGHPLLERVRGRVIGPTARGTEFVAHAREIVALNERAVAAVRRPAAGERIRLGMPADFLERDFSSILSEIRARCPGARLSLHTDLSARLAEDVGRGRLDLAFFKRAPSNEAGAAIAFESMIWFGDATSARGGHGDALPLVAFAEGCAYREEALRSLRLTGRDWIIACEARSLSALVAAVRAGLGYAALPARLGARKSLKRTHAHAELPDLNPVELALGIAEGRNMAFARTIGGIIAERCALA